MSVGHVPVEQIRAHTQNPRRTAVADEEMVDSIRALGVLTAVTVAPAADGDGFTLIGGHRRYDGACKAGLTVVPANIREDLVTEAQQLEAMLVENLHRSDLTPVEEAEAYEQLVLQGMDPAAIAAATGRKASTVTARLKLNGLAHSSRERLHDGQMTLGDAEALLEFAADPEVTATLEKAAGTSNFRWEVENARRTAKRKADRAEKIREIEGTGAALVDETRDGTQKALHYLPEPVRDAAAHDGCLAYVEPASAWQDPYLVCTDPGKHPEIPQPVAQQVRALDSDWEKQRAEREERAARRSAAAAVRLTWLLEHFGGMFSAKSPAPLVAAAKAFLPTALTDSRWVDVMDDTTILTALDVMPDESDGTDYDARETAQTAYAAGLTAAKPAKVMHTFGAWLAALVAEQLSQDVRWSEDGDQILHQLVLWDWLKGAGYPMSDADTEIYRELEVKHTELAGNDEAEAS